MVQSEYMKKESKWIHAEISDFDNLPETPAIYLVVADTITNQYLVLYVGDADNIKEKLQRHHLRSKSKTQLTSFITNYQGAVSIFYFEDDKSLIGGHKKYLINRFQPQLQDDVPNTAPINIKIPKKVIKGKLNRRYFE